MMQSLGVIQGCISSGNEPQILKGIEMLGLTGDERFWVNLRPFLRSDEIKIRHAAAAALEKFSKPATQTSITKSSAASSKDDSREIRFLALKMLARSATRNGSTTWLKASLIQARATASWPKRFSFRTMTINSVN